MGGTDKRAAASQRLLSTRSHAAALHVLKKQSPARIVALFSLQSGQRRNIQQHTRATWVKGSTGLRSLRASSSQMPKVPLANSTETRALPMLLMLDDPRVSSSAAGGAKCILLTGPCRVKCAGHLFVTCTSAWMPVSHVP